MRVLIIFNHPYEESYCNSILEAVRKGLTAANHQIDIIHLDNEQFDPVMRAKDLQAFALARTEPELALQMLDAQVLDYKTRIEQAEHLVFIFPIWWELMPALTKGFIDKLIFPSITYKYKNSGTGMSSILNRLQGMTMITTMNTPSLAYRLLFGNAIKKAMLMGTFWKIGIKRRKWIKLTNVKSTSSSKRALWLKQIENHFSQMTKAC